ncbi:MAG: alpha/beta fold hydrolase [Clostridia bacterium]|nr:alpha/beta fold hydrolase [Clostridia bacterium]
MKRENIIVGKGTNYPLHGLLTLPDDTSKPVPAVVFVHGSGASNRDEKVGKLTPFKDLAEGLAAHGIASVRYDKRSFAYGRKMLKEKNITVKEETIEDAVRATQLLRKDGRIDRNRIFIVGHSMGAMLAPRIDAQGGNYCGLILMAGSPYKLEDIILRQNQQAMGGLNKLLQWIADFQVKKLKKTFAGLYDLTDEEAKKRKFTGGTTLYYFKEMGEHPAPGFLKLTRKPLLILQGEKDFQASAAVDFTGYQTLLEGHDNATFKLYPGLNHAFVPALSDDINKARKEYAEERHIGDEVIGDIARWILEN